MAVAEFDLESKSFFEDPTPTLNRMRQLAPVYYHPTLDAWFLTTYEDVSRVLRDPRFSIRRAGLVSRCADPGVRAEFDEINRFFLGLMVFSDPPRHTQLRGYVADFFKPESVQKLRPSIRRVIEGLVAPLQSVREEVDIIESLAERIPARTAEVWLGLPPAITLQLQEWTSSIFAFTGAPQADPETVRRAHQGLCTARQLIKELIAKTRPSDGHLLSALVHRREQGPLADDDLLSLILVLIVGAVGKPVQVIAHAVAALMTHREQWQELCATPALAVDVFEETLRFDGPAFALQRSAIEDVVLRGHTIRAGQRIFGVLHAANHDPAVFPDPGRFDIRRRPVRQLGLGQGLHYCIGAAMTRMETAIVLECLAQMLPNLELGRTAPERSGNFALRGMKRLFVLPCGAP